MFELQEYVKYGKPMLLCTYSTQHLPASDKVRFYYALKGRDGKTGIVKEFKLIHPGRTVLLVPARFEDDIIQFFKIWNLPYTMRKIVADDEELRGGPP